MPYPTLGGTGSLELQPVGAHAVVDLLSNPVSSSLDSWALSIQASPGGYYGAGFAYNAGGVQNHFFTWTVLLAAGTWTVEYYFAKGPNTGITTLTLDPPGNQPATGQALLTQDCYAAASNLGSYQRATGIVVAQSKMHTVQVSCTSKNASSTGYYLIHQRIGFTRTA